MTIYISWPVSIDGNFRSAYVNLTGEFIQDNPLIDINGNHFVGSSRVTEDQYQILKLSFPSMSYQTDLPQTLPLGDNL